MRFCGGAQPGAGVRRRTRVPIGLHAACTRRIIGAMGIEVRLSTQFRVLGPLEVAHDGVPVRLGGERQRALLALLVTHGNRLVTTERLIEHLFGGQASAGAANAVHVAVSRLRRALRCGDEGLLLTRPGGYMLSLGTGQLDATRFERLLDEGRQAVAAGDAAAGSVRLREALALWRGPALADLALMEFIAPEARRLDELRLLALMERIDADLTLGRHAELIPELEGLVAAEPLRERLRQQQMLALYRADRRADALEVYRETSALLREELGLEPTRSLQDLERMVLRQDESLGAARDTWPTRPRPRPRAPDRLVCPFKGLASFDTGDAEYFCGRDRVVSELVARAAESTLVGILGPSGIGKSSLLRAGLLPALKRGALPGSAGWRQVLLRPGSHPCDELDRVRGRRPRGDYLSRTLERSIQERLDRNEQSLVLLNRRGFATAVFCRQCAGTLDCPNCSVSLVVHGDGGLAPRALSLLQLLCARADACPLCAGPYLEQTGFGTERVEAELKPACPGARVARLDRDAIRRKGALTALLSRFRDGEIDVLVGTQMIAKGHDFPRVTLVGVVSADVGLGMADFRASERTFQLLTQVAGRAGRGEQPGEAIVQTLYPDHYSIQLACKQDYAAFYDKELQFRRAMRYPPLVSIINTVVRARTFAAAMDDAADDRAASAERAGRAATSGCSGPRRRRSASCAASIARSC